MSARPEKLKSKRPANTAFKQQRLKAWQPILTPKTVLPAFFAVGAVFMPLGAGLYYASDKVRRRYASTPSANKSSSNQVVQYVFDYTKCNEASTSSRPQGVDFWVYDAGTKRCSLQVNIDKEIPGPVFMYYRLTNFYQNHRRYVKSFDAKQLVANPATSTTSCLQLNKAKDQASQYKWIKSADEISSDAVVYPCGLIANSYFSDEISGLATTAAPGTVAYTFSEDEIAWPSDADKFKNAQFEAGKFYPPPQWTVAFPGQNYSAGYTAANFPKIGDMKRFQVWMRPAGLPNFRKIYGKFSGNVPAGNYWINITNNFNVDSYGGTKAVVLSNVSILGGKNNFLGVAYIVVGALCWVLGIIFLLRHMIKPRKPGDYTYLSWNQPQREGAAVAPGSSGAGGR
ncbi:hypothetical protein HDU96_000426 [Phlyctochytrium bullatum]|nr:hypothetical protein HDU96_000426 [Phlyctochytrium bullatum]